MLVWVMRHMIVGVSQFKCGNNSIKFDKDSVRKVIGLPSGEIEDDSVDEDLCKEAESIQCDYTTQESKCSISTVVTMCLDEHNAEVFIRHFMLVVLATVIAPNTSNSVDLNYLKFLMRPDSIRLYDWATLCFDHISAVVTKFQKKKNACEFERNWRWYGSSLPLLLVWIYYYFLKFNIGM